MKSDRMPGLKDIREAHARISSFIHLTPVMQSKGINSIHDTTLLFKCENFQKVGAFKFRGATNAIQSLDPELLQRGVVTHSSGNHAAALALAASMRGAKAYIVMPSNSPDVKKAAVAGYGAEITYCEPTLAAREETANSIIDRTGATFVHAYDNHSVICGQGTAALELLTDYPDLDMVVCPVGGGGLLSGTATAVKEINSKIQVVAAEPAGADDTFRSFNSGVYIPSHTPSTIADGLLTTLSERTFGIIRQRVDMVLTAEDNEIAAAMKLIWERMKIIVEPSSAVTLAVVAKNKDLFRGKRVGVIISGGNVDLTRLPF